MFQLRVVLVSVLAACSAAAQNYLLTEFAGGALPVYEQGASANLNGSAIYGLAADAAGNLYFPYQCAIIRWDAASGLLTLVAGSGTCGYRGDNGPAVGARLYYPQGVALDSAGNLYIADTYNYRIRKVSNGLITTVAGNGSPGFGGDNASATAAMLNFPVGVALDSHNNLYIADQKNLRIREVTGGTITTVAGNGQAGYSGDNISATAAMLNYPMSVAVDPAGNVYIADKNNNRVRMVSGGVITTAAGTGTAGFNGDNISATAAQLDAPYSVATGAAGNLYIADMNNNRVRLVSGGTITTVAGNGQFRFSGDGGSAVNAGLMPYEVAVNTAGNLYIADWTGERLRKVTGGVINTVVGGGSSPNGVTPTAAEFADPRGLAVNSAGNLFIADSGDNRVWEVSNGTITTVAGTGLAGYNGDQSSATQATLDFPMGVAVDSAGNLYIADTYNNVVRMVANGVITTVAGNGIPGFKDNVGATSAQLNRPWGLAVDPAGSLYIADQANHRIRKVTKGVITTVAGNGTAGYSGDQGPATSASLNNPVGVAVDSAGILYIADANNNVIRMVAGGTITTFAGGGTLQGDNIPATSARVNQPWGVAVDSAGAVYIADFYGNRIRKVAGGIISTIAGGGDDFGDDAPAASVRIDSPESLAVDSSSNVYFGGWGRSAVFHLSPYTPSLLSASLSHAGPFTPGQNGATYTVTVSNGASGGATTGSVYVTETVPAGLTLASMFGTGWECAPGSCFRRGILQPGASYPPITVTVNVSPDASSPLVNSVTVSGGGSITATATDSTLIGHFTDVTIQTSPAGLQFTVDGGSVQTAPETLSLSTGSHTIAVIATQADGAGSQWVLVQWSDGCATASDAITVGTSPASYTAAFKVQHQLTIAASPAAGGTFTPASGGFYDAFKVVSITATPNTGYKFSGWSGAVADSSSPSTSVTMTTAESITANFTALAPITIQTDPTGLQFSIDGQTAQTAPQTLPLTPGMHSLAVDVTQPGSPGTQYVFGSWSDGGAASHTIHVGTSAATFTATFNPHYAVAVSISPSGAGTVTQTLSRSGYYNPGTIVTLTATANAGYQFLNWSGDLSGSANPHSITMDGPHTVTANFSALSGVTIQTDPSGLQFTVDGGTAQTAPQTLSLSQGSHTIAVAATQAGSPGTQYLFTAWSDGGAASHSITVTSSPATYTATFQTQYQLTIWVSPIGGGWETPGNGNYYNAAAVVPVTATANSGYTFNGWSGPVANPSSGSTSVTMNGPETITANYLSNPGITIQTNPPGLQISVDTVPYTAPTTLSLSAGPHTIAVAATQAGSPGAQYVFGNWSDGGAASHSINVTSSPVTYTATFQTQYQLTIWVSPIGGGWETPSNGNYYNAAAVVPVTATANSGYTFNGWSGQVANPSSGSTSVTMNGPETITANYLSNPGITIQTNPPGLQISVDTVPYTAPTTLSLSAGPHTIAVAATQAGSAGTQYVFSAWSDGGAASHSITLTSSPATYTATFQTQYQLSIWASPAGAGWEIPGNGTYYNAASVVQVSATPNSGYQFSNWSGDLGSSTNPQFITMNAAHTVTANFIATPPPTSCSITLSPAANLPPTGTSTVEICPNGSGQPNCGVAPETPATFTVTPSTACGAWTATSSNPEFLQIVAGSESGNGNGSVAFKLLNNTHTSAQTYSITIASGENSSTYPVIEAGSGDSEVYRQVYALYEQLLGRDPDAGGFAFWTGAGGAGLGQMADSFLTSPESFNSNFVVMAAYQAAYKTTPTFAQFTTAVASLRAGTQTVKGLFNSLTGAGYSAANLYQNLLNRAPTAGEISQANTAGLESWFETLIGYPSSVTPVSAPNNEFQSTGSFHTDHTNALYASMAYYVTVSRDPDPSGFTFWLGVANSGGPGLLFQGQAGYTTRIQILGPGTPNQGFIGSQEFQGLFAN